MNLKNIFINISTVMVVIFTIISCDDDFTSVGSEVIGDVNFEDNEYSATPIAYSKKFDRVQTVGLPNNLLGVYNDPVYGQSVYDVLSQVVPASFSPTFGDEAVLDSVVVNLPYFSELTATELDDDGLTVNTYELDSIYGSSPMKISMYRSNYFLSDFDISADSEERQLYYSDDINSFGSSTQETLITEVNLEIPSAKEVILTTPDDDDDGEPEVTTETPRLRIAMIPEQTAQELTALNPSNQREGNQGAIDLFTSIFLDKEGSIELSNRNNFLNFFRGIYFKTEPINGDGSLIFFDPGSANITLYYSFDTTDIDIDDEDGDGDVTEFTRGTNNLVLSFANNIVNGIDNDFDPTILEALESQDQINGEENLYLKGGEGSYAVIDLFNGEVVNENGVLENELDFLRRQEWLINEASIKLYVNQDMVMGGDTEPERIFIFNAETGAFLADYALDATGNTIDAFFSVIQHLEILTRDSDEDGEFYKIRLTRHITDILNEDGDNVQLGISVSQSVNELNIAEAFTPANITDNADEIIPVSSIISHEGTILYGNGTNVPEDKRLKLDIFYTELSNN